MRKIDAIPDKKLDAATVLFRYNKAIINQETEPTKKK